MYKGFGSSLLQDWPLATRPTWPGCRTYHDVTRGKRATFSSPRPALVIEVRDLSSAAAGGSGHSTRSSDIARFPVTLQRASAIDATYMMPLCYKFGGFSGTIPPEHVSWLLQPSAGRGVPASPATSSRLTLGLGAPGNAEGEPCNSWIS